MPKSRARALARSRSRSTRTRRFRTSGCRASAGTCVRRAIAPQPITATAGAVEGRARRAMLARRPGRESVSDEVKVLEWDRARGTPPSETVAILSSVLRGRDRVVAGGGEAWKLFMTRPMVTRFAPRGVELLVLPQRRGKTAAENAARSLLTGEIIINTDASVRIEAGAVKHLVAAFAHPAVGVASARDVSVANLNNTANPGELAYVGYEMWVRHLETQVSGIVGASGCLYAIRKDLHLRFMPEHLSRDFGAALVAREQGYRAVSVPAAICYVPRSASPQREHRRKVRTMARGLRTLWHKRAMLDPTRHGLFAWMLWSHKLCRWLTPWSFVLMAAALAVLAPQHWWAAAPLVLGGAAVLATA